MEATENRKPNISVLTVGVRLGLGGGTYPGVF
jgi:hypothetical protein